MPDSQYGEGMNAVLFVRGCGVNSPGGDQAILGRNRPTGMEERGRFAGLYVKRRARKNVMFMKKAFPFKSDQPSSTASGDENPAEKGTP